MIIPNKIPVEYFITKGQGESNFGSHGIPFESGSYDKALTDAGLSCVNIMTYTSIIPPQCQKIDRKKVDLPFGSVLDCIIAVMNGYQGDTILSCLLIANLYDRQKKYMGSFVLEYGDTNTSFKDANKTLFHQLQNMIENRDLGIVAFPGHRLKQFYKTDKGIWIYPDTIISQKMKIREKFGTVLCAIGFTKFLVP